MPAVSNAYFFPKLCALLLLWGTVAHAAETVDGRSRCRAMLIGLYCTVPAEAGPGRINTETLQALSASLVRESGFLAESIRPAFGIDNPSRARVGRLLRQLDHAQDSSPSRHARQSIRRENVLSCVVPLAATYVTPSEHGRRAAARCADFADDDLQARPVARAAYEALTRILTGHADRDKILSFAADASGHEKISQHVAGVRIFRRDQLRDESRAVGRLQRALFIWRKTGSYAEAVDAGDRLLQHPDSRAYLAAIAGATYGTPGLPTAAATRSVHDPDLRSLMADMEELAHRGILLEVPPPPDPGTLPPRSRITSVSRAPSDASPRQAIQSKTDFAPPPPAPSQAATAKNADDNAPPAPPAPIAPIKTIRVAEFEAPKSPAPISPAPFRSAPPQPRPDRTRPQRPAYLSLFPPMPTRQFTRSSDQLRGN